MKYLALFAVCISFLSFVNAQQFSVPEVTPEQSKEILHSHVIAYCATGITFAKTKGTSAKEYGEYIGNQFKPFWNPNDGFSEFTSGMMFLLGGMHPNNEMQIVEQSGKMIRFKMKNVDLLFVNGPAYGITYEEFLECSEGIISTLAQYMSVSFSHKMDGEWYVVTLQGK